MAENMKHKIAIFLPSLHGGGAERVMINLMQGFIERGYRVDLVLATVEGEFLPQVPSEVQIIDLRASRVLTSLPRLAFYLHQQKPEVLLSAMEHTNLVAIWAKKLACVPTRVLVSIHAVFSEISKDSTDLRLKIIPFLVRLFYNQADKIIAVSQGVAEDMSHIAMISPDKIKVLYNPIVTPQLLQHAEESASHPWFLDKKTPVIIAIGRLAPEKDFSTLIQAFSLVIKKHSAKLLILGEGTERKMLEKLIATLELQDQIDLFGFVENPYAYLKKSTIFVLSSTSEGFGNVIVEAMAVGTPVVSTNCGGPVEILENGKYGILVPVADPIALSHAILKTLQSPISSELLVTRSKDFSVEKITNQYLNLFFGSKQ